jgi:short-subunit dehydrogenase
MPAKTATEIWEVTGVPLSSLNQETVMSAEDCVDAALAGLDQGESGTLPSVEDYNLWAQFEEIRKRLYSASQTGRPASRYHVGFAKSHSSK